MAEVKEWRLIFEKETQEGGKSKESVGVIGFYIQNDDIWLNAIEVIDDLKRMNVAKFLISEGIKEYGVLLISSASKSAHKQNGDPYDCRYLEPEGRILIDSLVFSGIIKDEWIRNPFETNGSTN